MFIYRILGRAEKVDGHVNLREECFIKTVFHLSENPAEEEAESISTRWDGGQQENKSV